MNKFLDGLEMGDEVFVSDGPYSLDENGEKVSVGENGVGIFTGIDESKNAIFVKFTKQGCPRYVYIGPEYIHLNQDDITKKIQTIVRPHKIKKIQVKK